MKWSGYDIDDVISGVVGDVFQVGGQLISEGRGLCKNPVRMSEQQKNRQNQRKFGWPYPAHAGNSDSVASMQSAPMARDSGDATSLMPWKPLSASANLGWRCRVCSKPRTTIVQILEHPGDWDPLGFAMATLRDAATWRRLSRSSWRLRPEP